MKLVNLAERTQGVSPKYSAVQQPMKILHSTQELKDELANKPNYSVIYNLPNFLTFLKKYDLFGKDKYSYLTDINVWIATGEKFIPDVVTIQDIVMWKLDGEGKVIPTDNCFIQLHYLYSSKNNYNLYTSSGIFSVSMSKWGFTAGEKHQYIRPLSTNPNDLSRGRNYELNIKRILEKKRTSVPNVRVFHLIFNKDSPYFLDADRAVHAVYGNKVRKRDRERLIKSEAFQLTFLKEMRLLMPGLQQDFIKHFRGEKMAQMAERIFDTSIQKGTTEEMIAAYNLIFGIRESDIESSPAGKIPMVGQGTQQKVLEEKKEEEIQLFDDDAAIITKDLVKPEDETRKEEEEMFEVLRKETGTLRYTGEGDDLQ